MYNNIFTDVSSSLRYIIEYVSNIAKPCKLIQLLKILHYTWMCQVVMVSVNTDCMLVLYILYNINFSIYYVTKLFWCELVHILSASEIRTAQLQCPTVGGKPSVPASGNGSVGPLYRSDDSPTPHLAAIWGQGLTLQLLTFMPYPWQPMSPQLIALVTEIKTPWCWGPSLSGTLTVKNSCKMKLSFQTVCYEEPLKKELGLLLWTNYWN